MSSKSTRPRKQKQKDETANKHEIVAQVHRPVKKESETERSENTEESSESNKTYLKEDKNENYGPHTPSREISVDGETQISSKIISLIESEMKRDVNRHTHFTDSRPQSLSFYEDEKMPEELSGNLELLSPEERKHYKKRRDFDTEERNAYNHLQDALKRENDDANGTTKKSKKKKKHSTDTEVGLGDSREMMIPKEKRKSKKKKREYSPMSNGKRKHRRRDEDYEPRNDITIALEELQDDVFENGAEEVARPERMRSPKKTNKVYVQKKNRFEESRCDDDCVNKGLHGKTLLELTPLDVAVCYQKVWLPFTTLCHGLLAGIALAHYSYLRSNYWSADPDYMVHYANYSDLYTCLFYFLIVICLISVFDRYDVAHLDCSHLQDLIICRKSSIVIVIYGVCLMVHLAAARIDDKVALVYYDNKTALDFTDSDLDLWQNLSFWRALLAAAGWCIIALAPSEDLLHVHLKNMEKYSARNDQMTQN